MDGINGAVVVLGSVQAGRFEMFSGEPCPDHDVGDSRPVPVGVVSQAAQALFAGLRRKAKAIGAATARSSGASPYSFEVFASFVEVFDNDIQDLLDTSKRGLLVREDDREGVFVAGTTSYGPLPNSDACLELFQSGLRTKSTLPTDFGPRSVYASSVLKLTVCQVLRGAEVAGVPIVEELRSSLYIADVAGVEKLAEEADTLRMREGPTLNRGIVTLRSTAAALRTRRDIGALPVQDARLTHALTDPLGGNCLTSVVLAVVPGDGDANLATLRLGVHLRAGTTVPIVNGVAARVRLL